MTRRAWLGLVALVLATLAAFSSGPVRVTADPGDPIDPVVRARILSEGRARVLVRLRLPTAHVPEGRLGLAARLRQRADIKALESQVLGRLRNHPHRVLRRFTTVPLVAMDVGPAALAELEAAPNHVEHVVEDALHWPTLTQSIPLVTADQAWAAGFDGTGTVVAILDTGVDVNHGFVAGRVVEEACFSTTWGPHQATTLCPNGQEEQYGAGAGVPCPIGGDCSHGTHVAGIAAGNGANLGLAMSGVARNARIMSVQVYSRFDSPSICSPFPTPCVASYTSDQIMGLERVHALRSQYTFASANMSLGGGLSSTTCDGEPQKPMIDTLRSVGIATVISAGNNSSTSQLTSPGCISSAVSVGSTTKGDAISSFSNMAPFMSLLAPGSSITSSVPGGGFSSFSGTSMAAPHVAGAFAVLKQAAPAATVSEILTALQSTGLPIADTRAGGSVTAPRIRVVQALAALGVLPAVTIAATTPTVPEAGPGAGVLTVTRSGATTGALTVSYGVSGTATAGLDYQALTGTVTIPAGEASATIPVTPMNDGAVEGAETVIVTLAANAAYTIGSPSSATVTIQDDDVAAPAVCPAQVIVDNLPAGQSDAQRSFTGSWGGSGAPSPFGVNQSLFSNGAGTETYTWQTPVFNASGTCTYQVSVWWTSFPSRTANAGYTVSGQTTGPSTAFFDQRVNGGQWNLHGTYTFPAGAQGIVTVTDGSTGNTVADAVRFVVVAPDTTPPANVTGLNVTNPGTSGGLNLTWTNPASDFAGVVILRRADGPVTDVPTNGTTYTAGQSIGGSAVVFAANGTSHADTGLTDDTTYHYRVFAHDGARNYASGTAGSGTPTAPPPPAVTISATTPAVAEQGPGTGVFTVSRSGATTNAVTVGYTVTGSATAGADYQALSGSVTIPAGQSSATIPVTPLDDTAVEGAETVTVTLAAGAGYVVGAPAAATVSISDDDAPTTSCPTQVIVDNLLPGQSDAQHSFTGSWGSSGAPSPFGVNQSLFSNGTGVETYTWQTPVFNASGACTYQVFVWWTSFPSRTANAAYTVSGQTTGPSTAFFDQRVNGGQWNAHGTYTFPAGAQGIVTVTDGSAGNTIADAVRFVSVGPDTTPPSDVSGVSVSNPATGARLNLGWTNPAADFAGVVILRRAGSPVTDVPVPGVTYGAGAVIGNSVVVYAASGTSHADTGLTNGTTYHYRVFAHDAGRNYAGGVAGSGTPSAPTVTIAATAPTAPEQGPGGGVFTVTRTGPTTGALTVTYTVTGTAGAGVDYQALGGSVTIPAGQSSATIAVTPLDDSSVEGAETVIVTLASGAAYTLGNPASATATIQDDDTSSPACPAQIIVDNLPAGQSDAQRSFAGTWVNSGGPNPFGANASLYANPGGAESYTWTTPVFNASASCTYQVSVWWSAWTNRTTNAAYTVSGQATGPSAIVVNQRVNGGQWNLHGTYTFPAGSQGVVTVTEGSADLTSADAVRFLRVP